MIDLKFLEYVFLCEESDQSKNSTEKEKKRPWVVFEVLEVEFIKFLFMF